jgi:hypothetical protein
MAQSGQGPVLLILIAAEAGRKKSPQFQGRLTAASGSFGGVAQPPVWQLWAAMAAKCIARLAGAIHTTRRARC